MIRKHRSHPVRTLALVFLLLLLAGGVFYLLSVWRPGTQLHFHPKAAQTIRMGSLNVNGFRTHNSPEATALYIEEVADREDLDLLVLQEVVVGQSMDVNKLRSIFRRRFPYIRVQGDEAIFSRFPIINRHQVDFEGSDNSYSYNDLLLGKKDTLKVLSVHLQTTGWNSMRAHNALLPTIAGAMFSGNNDARRHQADLLRQCVSSSTMPVVMLGDLNSVPYSKVYRIASEGLKDAFLERGHGRGTTYRALSDLLRIDYVFHSPSIECSEMYVVDDDLSDHRMVVGTFVR